jgi:hypothetical protein
MSFKAKHPGSGFRNDAIQIIRTVKEGLLKEQIHITHRKIAGSAAEGSHHHGLNRVKPFQFIEYNECSDSNTSSVTSKPSRRIFEDLFTHHGFPVMKRRKTVKKFDHWVFCLFNYCALI